MKEWGVMDNENGESMEPMGEVPLVGLGESIDWNYQLARHTLYL